MEFKWLNQSSIKRVAALEYMKISALRKTVKNIRAGK